MKKRLALIIAAVFILMSMTGCGSSNEDAIKSAADGFLAAIQAGDYDKMSEYCIEDHSGLGEVYGLENWDTTINNTLLQSGINMDLYGDIIDDSLTELGKTLSTEFVDSYEITSVEEYEESTEAGADDAAVYATVLLGFDVNNNVEFVPADFQDTMKAYVAAHAEELTALYRSEGEAAVTRELMTALWPGVITSYKEKVLATEGGAQPVKITLRQDEDGNWLVTGFSFVKSESSSETDN